MEDKLKILLCFGTRPEAIKMAPLYHEFKKNESVEVVTCVTAQHREMLDNVLRFFEIVPDFDLNVMTQNQSLNTLSSKIIKEIDVVLDKVNPEIVIVQGDTTTTAMVALSCFHKKIKIAHVEAGLRTFDKFSPFPEEINRTITTQLSDFHFPPTLTALNHLLNEKIAKNNCLLSGNTVIDALLWTSSKIKKGYKNTEIESLETILDLSKKIILVTAHRRENYGDGFLNLCTAIEEIAKEDKVQIVFPVHLNPNVKNVVFEKLSHIANVHLVEPLEYPTMIWLMEQASFIISDSGGIQEEAPTFKKNVLVTRNTTERPEAVNAGFSILVGTNTEKIIENAKKLIQNNTTKNISENPYGNGNASALISQFLIEKLL